MQLTISVGQDSCHFYRGICVEGATVINIGARAGGGGGRGTTAPTPQYGNHVIFATKRYNDSGKDT